NQTDHPSLHDPDTARRLLAGVEKALENGAGYGSDVAGADDGFKARLILAFVDNDIESYRRVMAQVRQSDYASLYDDSALAFGTYCGMIPAADFAAWVDAFRQAYSGRQHYFKAAYRALEKGYTRHAVMLAEATARFFPDDELLTAEAEYLRRMAELAENRLRGDVAPVNRN
ncbi:MAG: hypothetical protein LIP23_02570, partial [Planctomycetes bacterium]|nr:hypothetical protein [Planctomycetota bacterium]